MRIFRRSPPPFLLSLFFLTTSLVTACDETPSARGDAPLLLNDAGVPYDGSRPHDGPMVVHDGSEKDTSSGLFCEPSSPCWEAPLPQGNDLNALGGAASDHVVAVGGGGSVFRFDGKDWHFEPAPVSVDFERPNFISVWVESKESLYALSNKAYLFHLKGMNWSSVNLRAGLKDNHLKTHFIPKAVWGFDATHVYIIGNYSTILHYDGKTVTQMKVEADTSGDKPPRTYDFTHIWGTAADKVWATSYQWIWHYDGSEWKRVKLPDGLGNGFAGIWGSSTKDIFVNGDNMLHFDGSQWKKMTTADKSHRGEIWGQGPKEVYALRSIRDETTKKYVQNVWRYDGASWKQIAKPPLGEKSAQSLWSNEKGTLFLSGTDGVLLRYKAGSGWTSLMPKLAGGTTQAIWGTDLDHVWAGRDDGTLLRRQGTTWTQTTFPADKGDFRAIWGIDAKTIFASVGDAMWIYDGSAWKKMTAAGIVFGSAIWGTSATNVYATIQLPENASKIVSVVAHYDGKTWKTEDLVDNSSYSAIWGSGPDDVYVVGGCGKIGHYDGKTWTQVRKHMCTVGPRAVWGSGKHDVYIAGWVVGVGRTSWSSADERGWITHYDGKTWTEKTLTTISRLNAIWGKDANEIYAVGRHRKDRSAVFRYDGMTWSRLRSDVAGELHAVWGDGTGHVFVGGKGGSILHRGL